MNNDLILHELHGEHSVHALNEAFRTRRIERSLDYFKSCYLENQKGTRVTIVATFNNELAGCGHLIRESAYPYFRENGIPEINDLIVFPEFRKKGIGGKLIDRLEEIASGYTFQIGIGVGLYDDYGSAQRLYCKKGYCLDGSGLQYGYQPVKPGSMVRADDDLLLFFTKNLVNTRDRSSVNEF